METGFVRKPRQHFDTAPRPQHVTFDDGRGQRRNFPWMRYAEARWDYDMEPDVIHVLIADWLVVIRGHNLGPLYLALEDQVLTRLCAQPKFEKENERVIDTFATEIRFVRPVEAAGKRKGQTELDLGAG